MSFLESADNLALIFSDGHFKIPLYAFMVLISSSLVCVRGSNFTSVTGVLSAKGGFSGKLECLVPFKETKEVDCL